MTSSPISNNLKQALLQWDDTDKETRAISKLRLESLGPETFAQINALLQSRARLCSLASRIGVSSFVAIYPVMFGFCFTREPHSDMPPLLICLLLGLLIIATGGVLTANWALATPLSQRAMQAMTVLEGGQGLGVLAEMTRAANPLGGSVSVISKKVLLPAMKRVQETSIGADFPLTRYQWNCLRHLINTLDNELTIALIQFFLHAENASALPQVRKIAKRARNWELQEAANDYLLRFAPDEVTAHHSPAEALQNAGAAPAGNAPILACVMRLGSRNPADRQAAANTLRAMQPEELTQILLLMDRESPADRRVSYAILTACVAVGALAGSLVYFWALRWPYFDARMASIVAFAGAFGGGTLAFLKGSIINYGRRNRRRAQLLGSKGGIFPEKRLLDVLVNLDNVALIGAILDHIPASSAIIGITLRRTLRQSLQNLLPRLQASDANLLSEQHRRLLNHELQRSQFKLSESWAGAKAVEEQAKLDIAILKAWEQVGDERALPFVQQLAAMTATSPAKKLVREAAEQCLPYLEARVGQQRQTQTLLRASEVPAGAGNVLLRAASPQSSPVETEQLLRAGIRNNYE